MALIEISGIRPFDVAQSRLTIRSLTPPMLRPLRSLTGACASTLLVLQLTAHGETKAESLLDPRHTRPLTQEERKLFGPKSAGLHYDKRMIRAAQIAQERAEPQKTWYCWRYVKNALLAAGVVTSRPTTAWARQAGEELCRKFGFVRLNIRDPRKAPVGAVIVYGGEDAGHVELRTEEGYVSDFVSSTPYPRPLLGVYVKPS